MHKALFLSLTIAIFSLSSARARVGETPEQLEKRYGQPISKDHPIFKVPAAKALLELPPDDGIRLRLKMFAVFDDVAKKKQPHFDDHGTDVDALLNALEIKFFLFQDYLIQVIVYKGKNGPFSLSETYLKATGSGESWNLTPMTQDVLEVLAKRIAQTKETPPCLKGLLRKVPGDCPLPLTWSNSKGRMWIDLSKDGDKKDVLFDVVEMHDFEQKLMINQAIKQIPETIRQAQEKQQATKGL